ncbi:uncharacterized protein ISCGN_014776 [Ixodes scapularis]
MISPKDTLATVTENVAKIRELVENEKRYRESLRDWGMDSPDGEYVRRYEDGVTGEDDYLARIIREGAIDVVATFPWDRIANAHAKRAAYVRRKAEIYEALGQETDLMDCFRHVERLTRDVKVSPWPQRGDNARVLDFLKRTELTTMSQKDLIKRHHADLTRSFVSELLSMCRDAKNYLAMYKVFEKYKIFGIVKQLKLWDITDAPDVPKTVFDTETVSYPKWLEGIFDSRVDWEKASRSLVAAYEDRKKTLDISSALDAERLITEPRAEAYEAAANSDFVAVRRAYREGLHRTLPAATWESCRKEIVRLKDKVQPKRASLAREYVLTYESILAHRRAEDESPAKLVARIYSDDSLGNSMSDLKEDDADAVEYRHLHLERDLKLYSKLLAELDATTEALRSAKADTGIDTCPNLNAESVVGTVFSVLSTLRSARAVKSKVDAWNESLRIKSLLIEKRSKPFTRDLFVFLSSSLSARSAAARWPNSDAPLAASSRSGFDDWYSNWVLPRYVCDESDGEAYATEMQFLKDRRATIEREIVEPIRGIGSPFEENVLRARIARTKKYLFLTDLLGRRTSTDDLDVQQSTRNFTEMARFVATMVRETKEVAHLTPYAESVRRTDPLATAYADPDDGTRGVLEAIASPDALATMDADALRHTGDYVKALFEKEARMRVFKNVRDALYVRDWKPVALEYGAQKQTLDFLALREKDLVEWIDVYLKKHASLQSGDRIEFLDSLFETLWIDLSRLEGIVKANERVIGVAKSDREIADAVDELKKNGLTKFDEDLKEYDRLRNRAQNNTLVSFKDAQQLLDRLREVGRVLRFLKSERQRICVRPPSRVIDYISRHPNFESGGIQSGVADAREYKVFLAFYDACVKNSLASLVQSLDLNTTRELNEAVASYERVAKHYRIYDAEYETHVESRREILAVVPQTSARVRSLEADQEFVRASKDVLGRVASDELAEFGATLARIADRIREGAALFEKHRAVLSAAFAVGRDFPTHLTNYYYQRDCMVFAKTLNAASAQAGLYDEFEAMRDGRTVSKESLAEVYVPHAETLVCSLAAYEAHVRKLSELEDKIRENLNRTRTVIEEVGRLTTSGEHWGFLTGVGSDYTEDRHGVFGYDAALETTRGTRSSKEWLSTLATERGYNTAEIVQLLKTVSSVKNLYNKILGVFPPELCSLYYRVVKQVVLSDADYRGRVLQAAEALAKIRAKLGESCDPSAFAKTFANVRDAVESMRFLLAHVACVRTIEKTQTALNVFFGRFPPPPLQRDVEMLRKYALLAAGNHELAALVCEVMEKTLKDARSNVPLLNYVDDHPDLDEYFLVRVVEAAKTFAKQSTVYWSERVHPSLAAKLAHGDATVQLFELVCDAETEEDAMSSVFRETSSSKDNLDYGSVFHDMDRWTTVIEKTTAIAERLLDKHADVFGFLERREGRVSAGNEASDVVLRAIARAANTWVGKHLWRELVAAELLRKHDYDADVVFRLYGKLVYSTTGKAFSSGDVPIDVYEFLKDNDPPIGTSPSMEVFRMMRPENVHGSERVLGYLYSHLLYEKTNPALVRVWFWVRGDKRSLQDFVRYASLVTTDWTRVLPEALRYYRNEGTQWVNFTMRVYAALCILRDNACHIETLITKTPMSHRVRVVIVEATRLSPLEAIMRHGGGASSVYEVEEYETAARRSQTRCDDDRDWLRDLHYMLNVEKQYAKSTFYEKFVRTVPMAQRLWDYLLNSSDYEATVRNFNRLSNFITINTAARARIFSITVQDVAVAAHTAAVTRDCASNIAGAGARDCASISAGVTDCTYNIVSAGATDSASNIASVGATDSASNIASVGATDCASNIASAGATDSASNIATVGATDCLPNSASVGATDCAYKIASAGATDCLSKSASVGATDCLSNSASVGATDSAYNIASAGATDCLSNSASVDATDCAYKIASAGATDCLSNSASVGATDCASNIATTGATDCTSNIATAGDVGAWSRGASGTTSCAISALVNVGATAIRSSVRPVHVASGTSTSDGGGGTRHSSCITK